MKVRNSLKGLMKRHRDNKLIRRKGRVYIINLILILNVRRAGAASARCLFL